MTLTKIRIVDQNAVNKLYFDNSRNIVDKDGFRLYIMAMEIETASKRLAELGNTTRLSIFRYLVKVGDQGAPVGQIQKEIGIPASTLSHHVNRLVSVGLIRQIRDSQILYCVPQYKALTEVIKFLLAECCAEGQCDMFQCK